MKNEEEKLMFNYLTECINKIGPITITQEFIDHREEEKKKFKNNGRSDYKMTMDADCLLLEWCLLTAQLAYKEHKDLKDYDFSLPLKIINFCDAKHIESTWFNIKPLNAPGGLGWFKSNVRKKTLTHFVFFKFGSHNKPFIVGDVVSIRLLGVKVAEDVLEQVQPSIKASGHYYYNVKA